MRIDNDCVRDILLAVEENTTYQTAMYFRLGFRTNVDRLKQYTSDKLMYHVRYLFLANYLYNPDNTGNSVERNCFVDLTPNGHEFLNTIRTPVVWLKTKSILEKAGAFSLRIVEATAEGVATAIIKEATSAQTPLPP